jgi:hypothetical protein
MAGRGEASPDYGTTAVCLLPCVGGRSEVTTATASPMSSRRSRRNVR